MNLRRFSIIAASIAAISSAIILAGCQGKPDQATIDAAPPVASNAKAPAPVVSKPGPIGGGDGASGGGAAVPAPVGGK